MSIAVLAPRVAVADEQQTGTLLRLIDVPIEDVRGLGETAVARLRKLLAGGVPFVKDRKRKRCYELQPLESGERFYIHVLRGAQKVLLLAFWKE